MELLLEALTYAHNMPPPLSSSSPTALTLLNSHSYGATVASPSVKQQAAAASLSTPSPLSSSSSLARRSSTPLSAALLTPDLDLNVDPFSLGLSRVVALDSPPRHFSPDQDSMGVPQKTSFFSFQSATPDRPGTSSEMGNCVEINERCQVRPFLRHSSTSHFEILRTPVSRPALSEGERLEVLNTIHKLLLQPNQSRIIGSHLAAVQATGRRSRVLDVGTGTGTWAMDLGDAQPYADVLGVDIQWDYFIPRTATHGNVDFLTVDVALPFTSLSPASFDVIHVQELALHIPRYSIFLERLAVLLRPGGLLVVVETEVGFSSANTPIPEAMRTWDSRLKEAFAHRSIDTSVPSRLLDLLCSSGVYCTPVYREEIGIPCGGYIKSSRTLKRAGGLHASIITANMDVMMPHLRAYGYAEKGIEQLREAVLSEVNRPGARFFQRLFAVYAHKVV